jgi:urea carboxylase-associated protein 2
MGQPPDASPAVATATLTGARDHARSQASQRSSIGPTVPASAAGDLPDGVRGDDVVWAETVGCGDYASRRLRRGDVLRISDPDGDACVQLLVHNALQPAERLNVADTVKVQWQAYLGAGALLLSDMGRVLMTIVSDTSERHDCLGGATPRRTAEHRRGDAGASGNQPNARDLLALGVAKFGLGRRDVGSNVNLFKSVRVGDDGALRLDGDPQPGVHVDLQAAMDVIVTVANCPHPLDDREAYASSPVRCLAWRGSQPAGHGSAGSSPERARAFENTAEYLSGVA